MKNLFYLLSILICISCSKDNPEVHSECDNGQLHFEGITSCLESGFKKSSDEEIILTLNYLDDDRNETTVEILLKIPSSNIESFQNGVIKIETLACANSVEPTDYSVSLEKETSGLFSFSFSCDGEQQQAMAGSFHNIEDL